ncbi:heavy metal response regulator transcription factor [Aurantiacibacter flavus]|uniref:Heavy metal response regulator transcription factor n=1 Tax=Aurantiacibacter flavus TaxID=3145232 RepID=A0ABV0D037_9SPHN
MKILIVEDEPKTRDYLRKGLSEQGWSVETATTGPEGLYLAQTGVFDAIVLDVMLPSLDGFGLLQQLRQDCATPVIMLTARDQVDDRVRGLRGGADDYLVKPFSFRELLARLDLMVRRHQSQPATSLQIGDLRIDFISRRVTRRARRLSLTAKEFALLEVLARRRSHIVSKTAIAELVWDINFETNTNVVEVAIKRLRAKLELPGEDKLLHTVRGMGYTLEPRDEAVPE